jgi:hypothetical protein
LCELDGIGHVGRLTASRDERRTFVHQPVVNFSGFLVAGIAGLKQLSTESPVKLCRRGGNRSDCGHDMLFPSLCQSLFPLRPRAEQTQRIQLKMKIIHLC